MPPGLPPGEIVTQGQWHAILIRPDYAMLLEGSIGALQPRGRFLLALVAVGNDGAAPARIPSDLFAVVDRAGNRYAPLPAASLGQLLSYLCRGGVPEVMLRLDAPTPEALAGFSAAAVGPGVGVEDAASTLLRSLWRALPIPAVFDADGLTALAQDPAPSPHPRAITPHPGEAGRLLGKTSAEVQADRLGTIHALGLLAPALLKGRHTLISGAPPSLNPTGHPGLAVAGAGDVLTGLLDGGRRALARAMGRAGVAPQLRDQRQRGGEHLGPGRARGVVIEVMEPGLSGAAHGRTVTSGVSCLSVAGPMPFTSSSSLTDLKPPRASRRATMRPARAGPTFGRASSSRAVARLRSRGWPKARAPALTGATSTGTPLSLIHI